MKILLPLLVLLLLSSSIAFAQETPEVTAWKTEQRCITAPSQPPDGWTYDGVIFTFKPGDGIHARRADVATPYYVAFDGDSEYGVVGRFSPDGRWFAVPVGRKEIETVSGGTYWFYIQEIRVYSTAPSHEMIQIPFKRTNEGLAPRMGIPPVLWLDNQQFVTQGIHELYHQGEINLVHPFLGLGLVEPYVFPIGADYVSASPDGSRLLYKDHGTFGGDAYRLTSPESEFVSPDLDLTANYFALSPLTVQWTSDSSRFAAMTYQLHGLQVYDRNGQLLDEMDTSAYISNFSFAADGTRLAYVLSSGYDDVRTDLGTESVLRAGSLQIADLETHTIIDTCIETPYSAAFSPDGKQVAFGLESAGYTYILDLAAWQAYRIDLAAADVMGWYSLEQGK